MAQMVAISLLAGMILGQRFKVLVLAPAMALTLLASLGVGALGAEGPWSMVAMSMATLTALQLGYLLGGGIRSLSVGARPASRTAAELHPAARNPGP